MRNRIKLMSPQWEQAYTVTWTIRLIWKFLLNWSDWNCKAFRPVLQMKWNRCSWLVLFYRVVMSCFLLSLSNIILDKKYENILQKSFFNMWIFISIHNFLNSYNLCWVVDRTSDIRSKNLGSVPFLKCYWSLFFTSRVVYFMYVTYFTSTVPEKIALSKPIETKNQC